MTGLTIWRDGAPNPPAPFPKKEGGERGSRFPLWERGSAIRRRLVVRGRGSLVLLLAVLLVTVAGCRPAATGAQDKVTLMLDWVPNTNHTGIYVALDQGWYEQEGIGLEIIQPGETGVEQVVGAGQAQFGISFAEWLTAARAEDIPIVSVAAIIQHNTSGFASRAELGLTAPADLEGKRYGGSGLDIERAMLQALMACDGASADEVQFVDVGWADFFVVTEREVDFSWIYYAWTGVEAEVRQVPLNVIWLRDYLECVPDYYTPVIITNEALIADNPELVRRFLAATARGYRYAIDNPAEAAAILAEHAEADAELVRRSQEWLSPRYVEDAPEWGYQELAVWERFTSWMNDNGLVSREVSPESAFTNEFLPGE